MAGDMAERAEALVFEVLDSELLGEGVLPTLRDARERLLTPGAPVVPARATVFAALVQCDALRRCHAPGAGPQPAGVGCERGAHRGCRQPQQRGALLRRCACAEHCALPPESRSRRSRRARSALRRRGPLAGPPGASSLGAAARATAHTLCTVLTHSALSRAARQVEYIVLNDTSAQFPAVCKYCGLRYHAGALLRGGPVRTRRG